MNKEIFKHSEKAKLYNIPKESISNMFPICEKDGKYSYLLNKTIIFKNINNIPTNLVRTYTIEENDTLFKISYKLFGNIKYWWFLAKINEITDVTIPIIPGRKLKYLNSDEMIGIIKEIGN